MSRAERIAARAARRAKRAARAAEMPDVIQHPTNRDPLRVYDVDKNTHHVLRDHWRGCSAFLVCGGPSLRALPIERLAERGIASLGVNNVAAYAPVKAFVCSDPPEKFHHGIWLDPGIIKLVPKPKLGKRVRAKGPDGRFRWTTYRVLDCPAVYGFGRTTEFLAAEFLTSEDASWGQGKRGLEKHGGDRTLCTFLLGLRLLHYLGVRRTYLLGVDFRMTAEAGYAFTEQRTEGAVAGNNNIYRVATEFCRELAPVFAAAGYEVYNCNPTSALDVWPHVPFAEALEDCRGHVPEGPFDTYGWYAKPDDDGQPAADGREADRTAE